MFSRQFDTGKQDSDKASLIGQLSESFHQRDLQWINDPSVRVERTGVSPSQIDWDHRHEWRATHEPGRVKDTRKNIKHGDAKPVALVDRPHKGPDDLFVMDGHHHTEAYTQLLGKPRREQNKNVRALHGQIPAFVIHVPTTTGPWDELHSRQEHNNKA